MKKVNLGKSTVVMSENINRKNMYVDTKHADSIKKDIVKELNNIIKTYDKLSDLLNKISYKKMFTGEYNSVAVQCSKKCTVQRNLADKLREDVEYKYNDDVKTCLINSLDERISYLESKFLSNK
jgi:hypothetical protein